MWTILLMSLIQMPQFAILPGTDMIATEVFPEHTLQTVQTAMSLPGLVAVICGVTAAMLVRYGFSSKKFMTVLGLSSIAMTGVVAIFLNTQFWQLCLMNILIGLGMGIYVPNAQSIMFDNFDERKRQFITGLTFSGINIGGLIMSLLCGILTTIVWYGGHLQMLVEIPVAIVAFLVIPQDKKMKYTAGNDTENDSADAGTTRSKLPRKVYYYAFLIIVFMIVYNVATMNISTHLAQNGIGDSSTAGIATALLMGGGVAVGFIFPKLSQVFHDYLFAATFFIIGIGFTLMTLFPASIAVTFVAMFICGATMSLLVPRCLFNVSNITDPTNSATGTMLVCCIAPGGGHFFSPIIMTNLTLAIGGESTRFRFQFTAYVCLALTVILFAYHIRQTRRGKAAAAA